jgi:hypothetical protein
VRTPARWQGTLLRSSSSCRRVLVVLLWRVVSWRAAAGGIARAAGLRCPPYRGAREGTEEGEREGRKRREEGQPSLTPNNSNFCIETQKKVNTKVVGNSKVCNFCVGQNSNRVMVQKLFWISKNRDSNDLSFHLKNFVFSPSLQLIICLLRQGKGAYSISQAENGLIWNLQRFIGHYTRTLTHNLIHVYVYENPDLINLVINC